jgi:hypothetical protein
MKYFVRSEAIRWIAYDSRLQLLAVGFNSGEDYGYWDVSSSVFKRFLRTESHGHFFQNYIRDFYEFSRLSRAEVSGLIRPKRPNDAAALKKTGSRKQKARLFPRNLK